MTKRMKPVCFACLGTDVHYDVSSTEIWDARAQAWVPSGDEPGYDVWCDGCQEESNIEMVQEDDRVAGEGMFHCDCGSRTHLAVDGLEGQLHRCLACGEQYRVVPEEGDEEEAGE
jgi:hypothetical protein